MVNKTHRLPETRGRWKAPRWGPVQRSNRLPCRRGKAAGPRPDSGVKRSLRGPALHSVTPPEHSQRIWMHIISSEITQKQCLISQQSTLDRSPSPLSHPLSQAELNLLLPPLRPARLFGHPRRCTVIWGQSGVPGLEASSSQTQPATRPPGREGEGRD